MERDAVDALLSRARGGASGALVVRGEAGIGKTALLGYASTSATKSGFRVVSSGGLESESQFAFAGLHQLCAPLLEQAAASLPEPQQAALAVAFGQRGGNTPDRFLVGLATLNLLAEAAESTPLLCVIDDVQWLDEASAQVFAFVARRVSAERIGLLFGLRESAPGHAAQPAATLSGMPELPLRGLPDADARSLLTSALVAPIDDSVRERIVAESCGNPMALLELPLSAASTQLAGGFDLPGAVDVPRRVEESFRSRSTQLPDDTRLLIVLAAAEPTGDVALLWRAAAEMGLDPQAIGPAEAAGLLEVGNRVAFRHPLVRSAIYRDVSPPERRQAHAALAAATDAHSDPDRRAWHRAQSVLGTDEHAAAELVSSAERARIRGGAAASAAFLEHAARLTPDAALRASRTLDAAFATHEAGVPEVASRLLSLAEDGPLDAQQEGRAHLLRARIAFEHERAGDGLEMLLSAAVGLSSVDAVLARETFLEALDAAIVTGGVGHGPRLQDVASAARAAPAPAVVEASDLLLDGLVTTFTEGFEVGAPALKRALEAFVTETPDAASSAQDGAQIRRWGWLASRTAMAVFDDSLVHALTDKHVQSARESGALATLPGALLVKSVMLVLGGELTEAAGLAEVAAASRAVRLRHAQLIVSAWRGDAAETNEIRTTMQREASGRGTATEIALAQYAMAVLHNGLGEYPAARDATAQAFESVELTQSNLAHAELIEAACRAGDAAHAVHALDELVARAQASGTPWGLGLAARSQALMTDGPGAEQHYLTAIEQLGQARTGALLARTHLVYGEWLRREGRRQDAREQLRLAHDQLARMGAKAFAERAARELRATGEHPRARAAQASDALTPHELHIARLVAGGATSREVGTQMFLSPRTIEAHLRNIFQKLGINSRRQLRDLSLQ